MISVNSYMYRGNTVFQIGPVVGKDKGGLYNPDCGDCNPPVCKLCTGKWWYYVEQGDRWETDDTLRLKCQGRK